MAKLIDLPLLQFFSEELIVPIKNAVSSLAGAVAALNDEIDNFSWDDISNKPETFAPSSHTHDDRYYTETEIDTKIGSAELQTTNKNIHGAINELKSSIENISYNDLNDKPNLSSLYRYKGTVANYSNLPSTNLEIGDGYNITNADSTHGIAAGDNVVWNGTGWDNHRGEIDLSGYVTDSELETELGTSALTTTDKTVKGAINELQSALSSGGGGSSGSLPVNPSDTSNINIWIET